MRASGSPGRVSEATGSDGARLRSGLGHRVLAEVQAYYKAAVAVANLVGEMLLREANGAGSGLVQPRISSAQSDQLLVQPVHRPAIGSELGGGRWKGRRMASSPPARSSLTPRKACSSPA